MLSPLALLWLLPIGGAITLLYLLKQKRQEVRVPSLMLWEEILAETASASPFQKLRIDLLLILQLLAALLFCIALARPFIWGDATGGKTVAIVIDGSASMNATDVPGGRFQVALAEASKTITAKLPGDTIALVLAGTHPVVLSPLSADKSRLLTALKKAIPSDAVNGPREALLLAGSLVASRPDARVVLITDGAFARQDELSLGGATLSIVSVGKESANVGITAFDVREETEGNRWEAFVTLRNVDTKAHTIPLTLYSGDTPVEAREVNLPADESRSITIPLSTADIPASVDLLSVRIESDDALRSDNEAFAALPSRRAVNVLLVAGKDDPFLERALSLTARAIVTPVAPADFSADAIKRSDLIVWDSETPPPTDLPAGRYLFFGAVPKGSAAAVLFGGDTLDAPPVLDWDHASPLLRFTNLAGLRVRTAQKVSPAPWASVLVESKAAPLMVYGERGETRVLYVAFRPTQSDFPLRVAFPVFISNAVTNLAGRTDADQSRVLRPGDTVPLPAGASVTDASGASQAVGGGIFTTTEKVGVYTVRVAGNIKNRFAVSLLSGAETQITPESAPPITITDTPPDGADPTKPRKSPQEWWPYLAAALLVLLSLEWWVFHRRKQ